MREIYTEYTRNSSSSPASFSKDEIILAEIGYDHITTATSFVEYLFEKYGFSKSSVWYNLKKLKKDTVLDFAEKGDEGKPLYLTRKGVEILRTRLSQKAAVVEKVGISQSGLGALNGY